MVKEILSPGMATLAPNSGGAGGGALTPAGDVCMVERAARALCATQGMDADAPAAGAEPGTAAWRTYVPIVETVLGATTLPPIPLLGGDRPEGHPDLKSWGRYRAAFGLAGAKAREPKLHAYTGWHVTAAWRTWNGMVEAALEYSQRQELTDSLRD